MPDFDLSVTICSWNAKDDLRRCLMSLREAMNECSFEVVIVENNSEDGSGEMAACEFPEFRLLAQPRNLGFTGGHNLAIKASKGRHVMLLNSDTIVHSGAIKTLIDYLDRNPNAGIVGPKLLNPDGSLQMSCRRFPNPVAALFRNTPLGRLFPNNRFTREYLMADFQHDETREVDWLSGAAMIISETALKKLGGLDPGYFMYCEDVDICWRAWKERFKVVYVPQAVITHVIGRSTDKAPNRMIGRFHRSMFRFYRLHMIPKAPLIFRPFLLAFAATALTMRASLFFMKNKIDVVRRWFQR